MDQIYCFSFTKFGMVIFFIHLLCCSCTLYFKQLFFRSQFPSAIPYANVIDSLMQKFANNLETRTSI